MKANQFLERLQGVKKSGAGWQAKCPGHDDRNASLSIREGDGGKVLIHCHAGCTAEAVAAAAGVRMVDLFPDARPASNGKGKIVAEYDYRDESGTLLFQVCRFEPKDFRQRKPDGKGGWLWKLGDCRRVLFRLPEITRAIQRGNFVFVCEGEKDCLAMAKHGMEATCNAGGAESKPDGSKWLASYNGTLRGADVAIIADKDTPGRLHAQIVAGHLRPVAKSVRVLELPDVNGKPVKDAADFFDAGGTAEQIGELVDSAPDWTPPVGNSSTCGVEHVETAAPETDAAPTLRALPAFDDAATLAAETLPTPPAIIEGLLRRGEKAVLGGASKSFKSWASLDIAIAVSHGVPWLGRAVAPGNALVVNLELPRWCLRKRVLDVAAARSLRLEPGRLILWTLRGVRVTAEQLRLTIAERKPENLALVIIDPAYKLLDGRDENSACDIGNLLANFEGIAADTGAAILIPAHFAKGNASHKESQDRISGSGVFARDPDSIITLTRHETDDAFTLEATLRTFPPVSPFVIRWTHPVFTVDTALDPARLKKAKPGPSAKFTSDKLLSLLPVGGLSKPDWRKKSEKTMGISRSKFYALSAELETTGKVKCSDNDLCLPVTQETQKPYAD